MGVIVFGVFFVPMSQNVLASNLVKSMVKMNPDSTQDIIQQKMQNKLPAVLLSSFGLHILFGTVLGSVTYFMARP